MRRTTVLPNDTIVAPATAIAAAGVAVVRLSGPHSVAVLEQLFTPAGRSPKDHPRLLCYGRLHDIQGEALDEILAVVMQAPHSYTGEDVVEFHCHGSIQVVRNLLDQCIDRGCRMAQPGEFTQRAFLNGRMDLSQAEAVIDLINAHSDGARRIAVQQLDGHLHRLVQRYREELLDMLALVESAIDFPEDEVDILDFQLLQRRMDSLRREIIQLLQGFDAGRILRDGVAILILGRPNVGKSSLLNALLGEARAIVTDIPGTTRDTIEENLVLGEIPLRLIDTAGVRETTDPIEAEGVARARSRIATSDLILLLTDASVPLTADDQLVIDACVDAPVIAVRNKADLGETPPAAALSRWPIVSISTHTGAGLSALRQMITSTLLHDAGGHSETFFLSDRRHREALVRVQTASEAFLSALIATSAPELLAVELRDALSALGEITGETTSDEVLNRIFSRFCIGK
jgi:tRNA modification GTPase